MKILIIATGKLMFFPYLRNYVQNIDLQKNDVHIVYWNRDNQRETQEYDNAVTYHEYVKTQRNEVSPFKKIASVMGYKHYVNELIKIEHYDYVIALTTMSGMIAFKTLIVNYKNRYIFDYRDSFFGMLKFMNYFPIRLITDQLIKKSDFSVVSSDGFRKYLPDIEKLITVHNYVRFDCIHKETSRVDKSCISIVFWGCFRDDAINKAIIERVAQDSRFELHYYGYGEQLEQSWRNYARQLNANNVYFHGEYNPNEVPIIAAEADLIHNIYDDENMMLAVSNKYYDGMIYEIPQLCFQGSFMGQKVHEKKIGLVCSPYDVDFCEKVYKYYISCNKNMFRKYCQEEMTKYINDMQIYRERIRNING